jgi:hypothetical protein
MIILHYADGTLLFLAHDTRSACHVKRLMACFEKIYGMKINYHKSDLTQVNLEEEIQSYAKIFVAGLLSFLSKT